MRRDEFMKELEYLLQDIPDEDKADAIAYYQDYLEEAGPEKEEEVIRDFGSPERVAAIIRADICGNLEDGGGFTEKGYEDERFREPNFQLVKRQEVPEEGKNHQGTENRQENSSEEAEQGYASRSSYEAGAGNSSSSASGNPYGAGNSGAASGNPYGAGNGGAASGNPYGTGNSGAASGNPYGAGHSGGAASGNSYGTGMGNGYGSGMASMKPEKARWEWWQILGMILLGCCIVPILLPLVLGVGGGAIGLIVGLGGVVIAVLAVLSIGLAAVTLALVLGGILLIILCFSQFGADMVQGILCLGTGVGIFGLGLLGLSLCGLYYGMFLPWLVKRGIHLIRRMIRGKEEGK